MQDRSRKTPVLAQHAGADHANEDVGIFAAPPSEGGVKAVDRVEIAAPECHVAAAGTARPSRVPLARNPRNREQRSQTVYFSEHALPHPSEESPLFGREVS